MNPQTVTVLCLTTDGTTGLHTVPVRVTHKLGCGCTRYRCDRPGTNPQHGGMEVLTGCLTHASDLPATEAGP